MVSAFSACRPQQLKSVPSELGRRPGSAPKRYNDRPSRGWPPHTIASTACFPSRRGTQAWVWSTPSRKPTLSIVGAFQRYLSRLPLVMRESDQDAEAPVGFA
jgi:hypothetical protein